MMDCGTALWEKPSTRFSRLHPSSSAVQWDHQELELDHQEDYGKTSHPAARVCNQTLPDGDEEIALAWAAKTRVGWVGTKWQLGDRWT
eukprot:CAMPEP_0169116774 /NCGR_PEP_ID=MMETSP1015-20121227/30079_1 /TAXON_ID=342587 /ORGANISM="Karlodinium micrum, Strain CCMP2283" /LENGTH=87 /DNA_ID=CAMNT_0009179363 /DNA_START=956 /DNA_END=1220 /DNA_ORIENTATION=-